MDQVLISLIPPREPSTLLKRVPCDIVLVIDVSASMEEDALLPQGQERTGLSNLDLTRHVATTIIESLDEGDRVGLIVFSTQVTKLSPLMPVTAANKQAILEKVEDVPQRRAAEIRHAEGANVPIRECLDRVQRHDVRMLEPGEREMLAAIVAGGQFQDDGAVGKRWLRGQENDALPATAQLGDHAKIAERFADGGVLRFRD